MSTGLELRSSYWSDGEARRAFKEFALSIHRLNLDGWEAAGYWDDAYRPFSFFEDGRVVANVCLYSMRMVVNGQPLRVGQISAVGTLPEKRRQGLSRVLTEAAVDHARGTGHSFFFLFADDEAVPYYRKLGFLPVDELQTVISVQGRAARPGSRRLSVDHQAEQNMIFRRASGRCPVSRRLGVLNERLLMFHALGPLRPHAWYVEPLDLVVFAARRDGVLSLFDVIGERMPSFTELYSFLADPADQKVVLHFLPDELGELGVAETRVVQSNNLHVSVGAPLDQPVFFPFTAHA